MNSSEIKQVGEALSQRHSPRMTTLGNDGHAQLDMLLGMMPEGGEWMVAPDEPTVLVLSNTTLFLIELHPTEEKATASSRPVKALEVGYGMTVAHEGGEPVTSQRKTTWTFGYVGHADEHRELRITGLFVNKEPYGPHERFARELARRAGWPLPEQSAT